MGVENFETVQKVLSLACVSLCEQQLEVSKENISKMLSATSTTVADYLIQKYVDAFKNINYKELKEMVLNAGIGSSASAASSAPAENKAEDKKKRKLLRKKARKTMKW